MQKALGIGLGAVGGAIVGYPLSYFFQPGFMQFLLPIGEYISRISEILEDKSLRSTAIGVWIASVVVFAVIGAVLQMLVSRQRTRS